MGEDRKKAICSILHFYSNHQISHGFPLKYKNENKLRSNAQGKIRKMWFVLLLFLYSSNMSVPPPPFFLKNDTFSHSRCSKSVFPGEVSNQQDSVLYLKAVMRSDRARGLSVFLHRQWRGWNTQLIGSGLHNHSPAWWHGRPPLGLSLKLPPLPRISTVLLYCHHFLKTSIAT